ncbi:FGGY-family carbohydrate kinase [Paenibacillus sp. OV219]|uniref:xylulokinase n=1 Tax=Paenibacillus sp. OV219 TaxID=1884377 RepID=UPI0008D1F902|nr:FGGY-family carbohydrate kinase [Paenibacillus sp. OV219]SEO00486.1 xylulokinase [Paenibacillus sp. OV219]
MPCYVIAYDVGTTGIKTCLIEVTDTIKLVASATEHYKLYVMENGGVEQEPQDWWDAMCITTERVLEKSGLPAGSIQGISFCAQMQGLVLVDKHGVPLRRAMSYMDHRAKRELKEGIANGLQIAGANVFKLLKSLAITGAVASSVKDPVWKYKWVQRNEPAIFSKVFKWLDVKEYLICKCTGEFIMTQDSAFAALLYDTRKGKECFSEAVCSMYGVDMTHLPRIVRSTDRVGGLTKEAASQLNLAEGTPVFGGGGDVSLIGVGAGAVEPGSTHIYSGTSGWVSTVVNRQVVDASAMIAAIVGANHGTFNYFAELETAGKCLEWVKDHLALDEINIYLEKKHVSEAYESHYESLYDYMMDAIKNVPAGSNGVIFTPWLHGNRCPFEDANARGMFFNIGLETGKTEMIHAVLEGICYHLRWHLEAQEKKVKTSPVIRFVGGGALAPLTCQMLSDILGRDVETVDNPHNVGAVGAAIVAAVGLGWIDKIDDAKKLIKASVRYTPNRMNKAIHDRNFKVFKALYKNNKKDFLLLNASK